MIVKPAAMAAGAGLFLAVVATIPTLAQEDGNRFMLERTENGYLRLDTKTGAMSLCRERGEKLVCEMAADERRAVLDELDALSDRVAAVERELGERSETQNLPSEEEFDRTMSMMERFMRRFFSIVEDLNRDSTEPEPEQQPSDRT